MIARLVGVCLTFFNRKALVQLVDHQTTPSLTADRMERSVSISA